MHSRLLCPLPRTIKRQFPSVEARTTRNPYSTFLRPKLVSEEHTARGAIRLCETPANKAPLTVNVDGPSKFKSSRLFSDQRKLLPRRTPGLSTTPKLILNRPVLKRGRRPTLGLRASGVGDSQEFVFIDCEKLAKSWLEHQPPAAVSPTEGATARVRVYSKISPGPLRSPQTPSDSRTALALDQGASRRTVGRTDWER